MKELNYQTELQRLIDQKQLVEVTFHGAPTYVVAYILSANQEFLTLAGVSSAATLAGITICRIEDIDSISVETIYLSELSKQISNDSIYQQAQAAIKGIREFTFDGFADALEKTNTVGEITIENDDNIAGRIIAHNKETLVLDEYSTESDRRIARTYFNRAIIIRISFEVPWLKTIARSLADKNL